MERETERPYNFLCLCSYKPSAKELFMGNIGGSVTDVQVHAAFVDYNLMHVRLPRHPGTGTNTHTRALDAADCPACRTFSLD